MQILRTFKSADPKDFPGDYNLCRILHSHNTHFLFLPASRRFPILHFGLPSSPRILAYPLVRSAHSESIRFPHSRAFALSKCNPVNLPASRQFPSLHFGTAQCLCVHYIGYGKKSKQIMAEIVPDAHILIRLLPVLWVFD